MGNHLVQRKWPVDPVNRADNVFWRGQVRKVEQVRDGVVTFTDGNFWAPQDGERYEVPEN